MGKPKDSSKNRKWEQIRRERLNQTFSDLCKELPSKTNSALLSKKAILVEALAFIQQLQKDKKELRDTVVQQQSFRRNDEIPGPADIRAHIRILLQRQTQLVELLQDAGIAVPPDPNAEQVSADWSPKIFQNGGLPTEGKDMDKIKKSSVSVLTPANGVVHRVVLAEKTKPMNPLSRKTKESTLRKKLSKKTVGPGPLVLQSLPPQLVLAPAPGSSPTVPVIVSVAGVKTLNPVIVVQSKSLVTCNTTASFSARPIRPCPAVRPPGTKAKVPIPALKPKTSDTPAKKKVLNVKGKTAPKKVESLKDVPQVPVKSGNSGCSNQTTVPEAASLDKNVPQTNDRVEPIANKEMQKDPSSVRNGARGYPDNEPKETAWTDKNGKRVVEDRDSMAVANKRMKTIETAQDNQKDVAGYENSSEQNSSLTSSPSKSTPKSGSYSISALCSLEQQQNQQQKQQQQQQHNLQQQKRHEQQNQQDQQQQRNLQQQKRHEQQNQQQNLHQQERQTEQNQHQQDKRQQKKQQQQQDQSHQQHLQQVNQQQQMNAQQQQQVCVEGSVTSQSVAKSAYVKTKEVYVPSNEQYLEWVEKSGAKSRFDTRTYHSFNTFSSPVVHTSRNTFMPIAETEVFDASENAFSLSLNAPDISGDLFTSLQVPNGGHHSESISPTAAFLLTFPLVSTSKATELLPDESVCDNTDSQSGMKTILQIGNIENDSSLNKCNNNIFNVTDDGLNNFGLASHFGQGANSQKDTHVIRNIEDKTTQANKDCTTDGLVFKEAAVLVQKNAGSSSLDPSGLYLNKSNQVQQNNHVSKPDLQASSIISAVELPAVSHSNVTATVGAKAQVPNKFSSSSEPYESQKSSTRERKDDRNSNWNAASSNQSTMPLNPFGDLAVTNTLRQDCSLNFPALPSSMIPLSSTSSTSQSYQSSDGNYKAPYSQPGVTSSFSIAQTSSNIGILSWSTLPPADSYNSSRNNPKLARFHDIFSYRNTGSTDAAPLSTNYVSNVMPSDPKTQTNYVSVTEHSFFQEPTIGTDARSKATVVSYLSSSSSRPRPDGSHFEGSGKKQFSSNSVSTSKQVYDQGMPQYTHAMIESKQLCSQDSYKHNAPVGQYSAINVQSKQNMNGNFDKVSRGKQIPTSDAFSSTNVNGGKLANYGHCTEPKEGHCTEPQRTDVQSFSVNAPPDPKPHGNVHFNSVMSDGKKSSSNNINNSSKERVSLGTYISSNGSVSETRMPQFNQTDSNNVAVQQKEAFKPPEQLHSQVHKQSHPMNQKGVQKQYHQPDLHHQETNQVHHQEQQLQQSSAATTLPCTRSSKATMSIHRPPVNWMTAPDIRSSLQNSPAFGNNQTAFYIPDHQKDADNAVAGTMYDTTNGFHGLDLPHSCGQSIYKSSDLQLLGSDQLESIHEPTAWSPSKSGNNSVLGSMLMPSTLPTLVGDLALGDSNANISRPFLPTFTIESSPCSKKTSKRSHSTKNSDKAMEDGQVVQGAEFSTNFLSVSQLVDSGVNRKGRPTSLPVNRIIPQTNLGDGPCYPVSFPDQDVSQCPQSKPSSAKCPPSSYSAEALLSSSVLNSHQMNRRKRTSNSSHFSNNYVPTDGTSGTFPVTSQSQCNFLPDLSAPRSNDFQGGLSHSETPLAFMVPPTSCNTSGSHRSGNTEDESLTRRVVSQNNAENLHLTASMTASKQVPNDVAMSYESNFPAFLPPVSVAMTHHPYAQDTLYSTPRFQMHPNANNHNGNIQSPSANTLTNFHLSTIFPEINGKDLC